MASRVTVDVADEASTEALASSTRQEFGGPNILVHCAGISGNCTATSTDTATWDRVLAVDLTGTFLACRAVLPDMVRAGRGSIVNIASVAALVGIPGRVAYTAAKAGVAGLTRALAVDHAGDGVRVNALVPGTVPTPLVVDAYAARGSIDCHDGDAGLEASARRRYPAQRLGTIEEVAQAAVFLAGDDAPWIAGVVLL